MLRNSVTRGFCCVWKYSLLIGQWPYGFLLCVEALPSHWNTACSFPQRLLHDVTDYYPDIQQSLPCREAPLYTSNVSRCKWPQCVVRAYRFPPWIVQGPVYIKRLLQLNNDASDIVLSERNEVTWKWVATLNLEPLSLASSQICHSIHSDVWCKWAQREVLLYLTQLVKLWMSVQIYQILARFINIVQI